MSAKPIALIEVDAVAPDGRVARCKVAIHTPERQPTGEYGCSVIIPNHDKPRTIYGEDSLQSLTLAIRFLSQQLRTQYEIGWRFHDSDCTEMSGDGIPFDVYFFDGFWPDSKNRNTNN